jgi:KipI family sensor histidine kinase inhibitor
VSEVEVVRVGEREILVRFPALELAEAVRRAQQLRLVVEKERQGEKLSLKGKTTVLGAGSLLVAIPGVAAQDAVEEAERELRTVCNALDLAPTPSLAPGRAHEIEVRYGGDEGVDLVAVARERGLSPERVVELHAGAEYVVAFVGFSPGFAYLIGLPRELELPRLVSPRERVPAGSVAIAGPFSAVYPHTTPGGWRLLGRTKAVLFDPAAEPPARLAPGDRVRFVVAPR